MFIVSRLYSATVSPNFHAVLTTVLALVVTSSTQAATTYRRDIAIEPVKVPTLIAVELDERVYANTDGLPEEARVYSAAGRSVGFVVQDVRGRQVSNETISWPGTVTRAEATGDGPLVIECTSPAKQPWPGSMVIETPLVDFQQLVRTEVQLADGTWKPAAEETLLADYSRFVNIRQNEITLKQPEAGMAVKGPWTFRLTILQPTPEVESRLKQIVQREGSDGASSRETRTVVDQRPFKINAIRFEAKVEKEGPEEVLTVDWVPPMSKTVHGLTGKSTVTFIAGSRPVNGLSLEIAGTNFSRTARFIAYRENEANPSRRQDVTLRKIDIGNLHRDETRLVFPSPIRERMLQFEIDDQNDPPLEIERALLTSPRQVLIFLAEPGQTYTLEYGDASPAMKRPSGDIVATALRSGEPTSRGPLGPEQIAATRPPEVNLKSLFDSPWLWITALGSLAVLLALMLFRTAKELG